MNYRKPNDSLIILDNKPADSFNQAYPIGNGKLGAMIYGKTDSETISLNEDTLWSGYPRHDKYRNDGYDSLVRAKALMKEKKYHDADEEITNHFTSYGVDGYQPLATLRLTYDNAERKSAYRRWLDLSSATVHSTYKKDGGKIKRVAFASNPDNVIAFREEAENTTLNFNIELTSRLYARSYFKDGFLIIEGECPITTSQNIARTDRKTLYSDIPEEKGIHFRAALGIKTDGKLSSVGDHLWFGNVLRITGATYAELYFVSKNSFNGYDKHPYLEGKEYKDACIDAISAVMEKNYGDILSSHIKDYKKYFGRVKLNLGSSNKASLTTEKRMLAYEMGEEDKALPALLFNFGRYLTIAASRKGTEPTHLQGMWNEYTFAPWNSDYTVNINTEMNYFPTLMTSMPEMYEPLLRLIKELSVTGKKSAKALYHADGWVCHHVTDIWRNTQPASGMAVFAFWHAAGGWFCHHLFEYYEYTLDEKFLKNFALPIMEGAIKFYLTQLEDSDDGYRIIFPMTSPENFIKCEGGMGSLSETSEMSMAILRELFANYIESCRILGVENDTLNTVKSEFPRLRPTMIGEDGRIMEWYTPHEENDVHHRHVSHLYALHPGHAITPEKTPELAKACLKSLDVRGDESTGWSLAWKANLHARLNDGNRALKLIKRQLKISYHKEMTVLGGGGSYSNLLCAHPPFQIDGNFGATSAICEMLMRSERDCIYLLPARPDSWEKLSVHGLTAKGKRRVSIGFENGKLSCKIKGTLPSRVIYKGENIRDKFTEQNGVFTYAE